jgi:uncharacterized protein (TIGR02453 family)
MSVVERQDDFEGFPVAALDFYDDLELDNTKSFWAAHRQVYEDAVRAPMTALMGALAEEFGPGKVFRPHRDVRFANDKTPYKDHQGGFVPAGPGAGWYVEIGAPGVRVGAGVYHAESARLAAIRGAIDHDLTGPALERILVALERKGWSREGERLRTTPRGYPADHPRLELLRHKSLYVGRGYGFDEVIHSPRLLDQVRTDWRAARPLVEWVSDATARVGPGADGQG